MAEVRKEQQKNDSRRLDFTIFRTSNMIPSTDTFWYLRRDFG